MEDNEHPLVSIVMLNYNGLNYFKIDLVGMKLKSIKNIHRKINKKLNINKNVFQVKNN
jgi:hypothetical protein